jgi:hypothetical protein
MNDGFVLGSAGRRWFAGCNVPRYLNIGVKKPPKSTTSVVPFNVAHAQEGKMWLHSRRMQDN